MLSRRSLLCGIQRYLKGFPWVRSAEGTARIMALEGASKAKPSAQGRNPNQSRSNRQLSNLLLNASSLGALTTSWSHWFHCRTALTVNKFLPIFSWNLAPCGLSPMLLCDVWEQILPFLCMPVYQVFEKYCHICVCVSHWADISHMISVGCIGLAMCPQIRGPCQLVFFVDLVIRCRIVNIATIAPHNISWRT